jgi:hypothetical protein
MNGKAVAQKSIDFFVPPEDHKIQIKGVRGPEALNTLNTTYLYSKANKK